MLHHKRTKRKQKGIQFTELILVWNEFGRLIGYAIAGPKNSYFYLIFLLEIVFWDVNVLVSVLATTVLVHWSPH